MDKLAGFVLGFVTGVIIAIISLSWNESEAGIITIAPIKDKYRNEIIYYIDINTKKTYKMENDVLYYYEEVTNE